MKLLEVFEKTKNHLFPLAWASLLYIVLNLLTALAGMGIISLYILLLSFIGAMEYLISPLSAGVVLIVALLYAFLSAGYKGGVLNAYLKAYEGKTTSITEFYSYSLDRTLTMFGLEVIKHGFFLIFGGPLLAIYYFILSKYQYTEILTALALIAIYLIICLVFSPAFLWAGAYGANIKSGLKKIISTFRKHHIHYIAYYALLLISVGLSIIPIINIATLFLIIPLITITLIKMVR